MSLLPRIALVLIVPLALFAGALALPVSAASQAPAFASDLPVVAEDARWHVVDSGESLRSIARRYYGSSRMWRTLQVANDVDQYPPVGSRLWLPAGLPAM
ncbi:MAG: hypothetical protein ACYTF0_01855 [Planctomycetota bacterium]|jgi:nucleoid-associated protein YgaU